MPGPGPELIGLENGEAHFLVNSCNAESQASSPELRLPRYESTARSDTTKQSQRRAIRIRSLGQAR